MSDRVTTIDENNVVVDGIAYKTTDVPEMGAFCCGCEECIFEDDDDACSAVPCCTSQERPDGREIIWVTAV